MEVKLEEDDWLTNLRELGPSIRGEGGDERDVDGDGIGVSAIKAGDLFFFQFPPVLPPLAPVAAPPIPTPAAEIGSTADSATKPDTTTPQQNTQKKRSNQSTSTRYDPSQQTFPPGVAGQLRLHRSGRVSILWGVPPPPETPAPPQSAAIQTPSASANTTTTTTTTSSAAAAIEPHQHHHPIEMVVTRGIHCEFLQDVVVMKPETESAPSVSASAPGSDDGVGGGSKKESGKVWSLGQVKGKFVVAPDLEALFK